MKKTLRILALLMALLMALSGTALAAESSVYTLALANPVIYMNNLPILDLTNLEADLNFALDDNGLMALLLGLYVNKEVPAESPVQAPTTLTEELTTLTAQLSPAGVTLALSGMNSIYNYDLSEDLGGLDISQILAGMQLRNVLNTLPVAMNQMNAGYEMTAKDRQTMIVEMLAELSTTATTSTDGTVVRAINITEDQGQEMLYNIASVVDSLFAMMDMYLGSTLSTDSMNDWIEEYDVALSIIGTVTQGNGTAGALLNGELYSREEGLAGGVVAFTLTYTDNLDDYDLTLTITPSDEETLLISTYSELSMFEDGSMIPTENVYIALDDEVLLYAYDFTTIDPSDNSDVYSVVVEIPEEDLLFQFMLNTNFQPAWNNSTIVDFSVTQYGDTNGIYLAFVSDDINDVNQSGQAGLMELSYYDNSTSYTLSSELYLLNRTMDSANWYIDPTNAVDLATMTEEETVMMTMGLLGILGNSVVKLENTVPTLSALLQEALVSAMMG